MFYCLSPLKLLDSDSDIDYTINSLKRSIIIIPPKTPKKMTNRIIIERKQARYNKRANQIAIIVLSFTLGLIVANLI